MFKRLGSIILASVMALSLAGCSAASNSSTAGNQTTAGSGSGSGKTKITIAAQSGSFYTGLSAVVDEYYKNAENSEYDVEMVEIVADNSDVYTKGIMMMSSPTTCPDIVLEDGFRVNEDAMAGYLTNLDSYTQGWKEIENWSSSTLEGAKAEDGSLYAIPVSGAFVGLWYNEKLLTELGYEMPWQPQNWDEMIQAARDMQAAQAGNEEFIPFYLCVSASDSERTSMKTFQTLLSGLEGGTLYDFDKEKWIVDNQTLGSVIEYINHIYNVEHMGPELSLVTQTNQMDVIGNGQMKAGNVGLLIESQNVCTSYWSESASNPWPEWDDTWGFCMVPTQNGQGDGYTSILGGWTVAIPENAQHKEEAWDFIANHLGTYEGMLNLTLTSSQMTPREDVSVNETYVDNPGTVYRFFNVTENMKYGSSRPTTANYSNVSLLVAEMAENAASGGMTTQEIIDNYHQQLIRIVGEEKIETVQ